MKNEKPDAPARKTGKGSERPKKPKKPVADWERIELDYRAGIKTLRQIGDENGVSHTLVARRAKKQMWERDLSARIHAKADQLVSQSIIEPEMATRGHPTEQALVSGNAEAVAKIRLAHRGDIHRTRTIVMALVDELGQMVGGEQVDLLRNLGELLRCEDDKGNDKLNDLYLHVISLPQRVKSAKDLSEALGRLVALERQAFGILDKEKEGPQDPFTTMMERITSGANSTFLPVAADPDHDE